MSGQQITVVLSVIVAFATLFSMLFSATSSYDRRLASIISTHDKDVRELHLMRHSAATDITERLKVLETKIEVEIKHQQLWYDEIQKITSEARATMLDLSTRTSILETRDGLTIFRRPGPSYLDAEDKEE